MEFHEYPPSDEYAPVKSRASGLMCFAAPRLCERN